MPVADFQAWVDARTESYFSRDFETYRSLALLPVAIATRTTVLIVQTEADLKLGFDAWADMLGSQRATHMISTVRQVDFIGEDMMTGTYDTELLAGTARICPPYRSTATLRRVDGIWKVITVANGLSNSTWPIVLPKVDRDADGQELIWTGDKSPKGENDG